VAGGRRLEGRAAIVTGAAQGLGRAFALRLANEGANVVVCDVLPEVAELARAAGPQGGRIVALLADVTRADDVRRVVDEAVATFGGVELLVNNAGAWRPTPISDPLEKAADDYDVLIGTNLRGSFLFGRAAIPHLVRSGGDIVQISTDHLHTCGAPLALDHTDAPACPWADRPPRPTGGGAAMDLYDASKWGLNGLVFEWARALAPHRVRVNALCMGATDSPMLRAAFGGPPDPAVTGPVMRAEDIAELIVALVCEGKGGRNGTNLGIAPGHPIALPSAHRELRAEEDAPPTPSSAPVDLAGRMALVSPGTTPLAEACARALLGAGVAVALCDADPAVERVVKTLAPLGDVRAIVADGATLEGVQAALAASERADILVTTSAEYRETPVLSSEDEALEDFTDVLDAPLRHAFLLGRAALARMIARGSGDVVHLTGAEVFAEAAGSPDGDCDLYQASRWALNGLTQAWASAAERKGVRVNGLAVEEDASPDEAAAGLIALLREGPQGRTGQNTLVAAGSSGLPPAHKAHRAITG
jgi:NAD(P)-dependent dehydrogenase (short-subunit alcohol dehydrogenase family)